LSQLLPQPQLLLHPTSQLLPHPMPHPMPQLLPQLQLLTQQLPQSRHPKGFRIFPLFLICHLDSTMTQPPPSPTLLHLNFRNTFIMSFSTTKTARPAHGLPDSPQSHQAAAAATRALCLHRARERELTTSPAGVQNQKQVPERGTDHHWTETVAQSQTKIKRKMIA